jgi:hypothetical protein
VIKKGNQEVCETKGPYDRSAMSIEYTRKRDKIRPNY